jgi:hypothetical protein
MEEETDDSSVEYWVEVEPWLPPQYQVLFRFDSAVSWGTYKG